MTSSGDQVTELGLSAREKATDKFREATLGAIGTAAMTGLVVWTEIERGGTDYKGYLAGTVALAGAVVTGKAFRHGLDLRRSFTHSES